jgi:hypothetical protein
MRAWVSASARPSAHEYLEALGRSVASHLARRAACGGHARVTLFVKSPLESRAVRGPIAHARA